MPDVIVTTQNTPINIEIGGPSTPTSNEVDPTVPAHVKGITEEDIDNWNNNNIGTEATTRANADITLQTNITNEAATRANADSNLQNSINSEIGTRSAADDALQAAIDANQLYEEILLADFQSESAAGTLVPGRTYAITDLLSSMGDFKLLVQGLINATDNGVANGTLIYTNFIGTKQGSYDVQFDIVSGTFLSFYNRAFDIRCNSESMFNSLHNFVVGTAFYAGKITGCNFSNYTGTLTLDSSGNTTLKNCDFSDSSADFDTTELTVATTFSGRILHDFVVPDQTSFPCDFANTIQINADGTNNMMATITLAASQTTLDYTGFKSAGIVKLVPDSGGNTIDTISNAVVGREYKIISDDVSGVLNLSTGINIGINAATDLVVLGMISWIVADAYLNEIFFIYNGTKNLITAKTNIYLY